MQAERLHFLAAGTAMMVVCGCSNSPYPSGQPAQHVLYRVFRDVTSFDPTVSYNTDDGAIMDQMYPTYFRYQYLKRPYVCELNLGDREPVVTDLPSGAEDWTFHLRPGLRFQDDSCFPNGRGRPIDARDIGYSFKRMCDPSTVSPIADFLADKVKGWKQFSTGFKIGPLRHYDDPLPGFTVSPKDPNQFTVHLVTPYPQLRYIMAMHFTTPIAREAVEKYKDTFGLTHPVGSGAYKMQEFTPGRRIVLVKNANTTFEKFPSVKGPSDSEAILQSAGQPLPLTPKLIYTKVREDLTSYNLFQQGYIDALSSSYANVQVMPGAASLTENMRQRGVDLKHELALSIDDLAFNMRDPVFGGYTAQRRALRQAISLAVNSSAYIDIIDQKMGAPAQFLIPPGLCGYDPNYKNPYREFDPKLTRSKQLLAEAGYPNGVDGQTGERLTLHFDTFADTPALRQMERLFISQIETIGIRVEPRESDYATYTAHVKAGEFQFIYGNWFADYPDAENFVQLLYSPNATPGPNSGSYKNVQCDRLFEKMRAMIDSPARAKIIHEIRDLTNEDCPNIYLTHLELRTLVQPWVSEAREVTVGNEIDQYFKVDPDSRVRLQTEWNPKQFWPVLAIVGVLGVAFLPALSVISQRRNRKVRR